MDAGGPIHEGETAADESCFKEVARFRICPGEGQSGIQIPKGLGIVLRCMSLALSLRLRMGRMGSSVILDG